MVEFKSLLGIVAIAIGFAGYTIYLRDVISGKAKPHAFSWLIWTILVSIIFTAQYVNNGAAGSWVTAFTALFQCVVFSIAIFKGDRKFSKSDWGLLCVALISLLSWYATKDPIISVILITLTDFFAFVPTLRKGYTKPWEDSVPLWAFTGLKWCISIIALSSFTFITLLYPVYLFCLGTFYSILLIVRRKNLTR